MPAMTAYRPGTFSWADLAAHDAGAAERFYTALFGWTARHDRFGPGDDEVYVMLLKDERAVAALYAMDEAQKAEHVPSAWLSYVTVEDVAASTARARELGGVVLSEVFDVMDYGRMALLADPGGALLALWEPGAHIGAEVKDEAGAMCWNELATGDTARAGEFYRGLFGWTEQALPASDMPYTLFMNGDAQAGGMYALTPEIEMPPSWTPYFATDDADETVRRARELGGTLLMGPQDISAGRFALLRDPQGALFYVIRATGQNS
jgi:predicted enzyme related to lactoylglutathione lyase